MKKFLFLLITILFLLVPRAAGQEGYDYSDPERPIFGVYDTANIVISNHQSFPMKVILISRKKGATEKFFDMKPMERKEFGHFHAGEYFLILIDPFTQSPHVVPFRIDEWCADCEWKRRSDRNSWDRKPEDFEFRKVIIL